MEKRTALLLGATGLVGGLCLEQLLQNESYGRVVTLVRRSLARQHPKLITHIVDFDRPESFVNLTGADDVFSCLGTTRAKARSEEAYRKIDVEIPKRVAESSLAHGAQQFLLVSAIGSDPKSLFFYSRLKAELDEAVSQMPFAAVHIFRPGLLLGHRSESRPAERFVTRLAPILSLLLSGPWRKYRPIEAAAVARAMVRAAMSSSRGVQVYEYDRIVALASERTAG